jgi:predicted nuclease of restriction endonuclease-like RecB superfamily
VAHKALGPDQFGIDLLEDGFRVFLPDRLIPRDDLRILLEGIRDLVTEYNNVTMEALREAQQMKQLNLLDTINQPEPQSESDVSPQAESIAPQANETASAQVAIKTTD